MLDLLTRPVPSRVAMVGLGPSANAFWLENSVFNAADEYDEVWAVNRAAVSFRHDLAWNMHDLRELVKKYPQEGPRLYRAEKPLVTLEHFPEFPTSVRYPIAEVLTFLKGYDMLNSTPAYMVAYAVMVGVKELLLYGMDFHYENLERSEAGGQGMAYLLGFASALGMNYKIPPSSSLLDAYRISAMQEHGVLRPIRPLYGYDESPTVKDPRITPESKILRLVPGGLGMTATQPRYRLGEAEQGDAAAGGNR